MTKFERLDGFTQAFISSMVTGKPYGFADLSPDALARIIADCEAFQCGRLDKPARMVFGRTPPATTAVMAVVRGSLCWHAGRHFWLSRQGLPDGFDQSEAFAGTWAPLLHKLALTFPPLTVHQDAQGVVTVSEA
ncbi:hypothetical protein CcrC1_gp519 [Caulobacter phage C1]|nr:hypothetical protein CcrC1_gp026 [Caulobacter phage C1]UTU08253.1 hypothetical protein CcrC2_gp025 [Caulobacter phage C2]UTU08776.1 hypothetical protein CcrJ4_gp025 [Caulobacter phage J4]UTU09312.1 hypothetical protein CcrBL47_gp026 [Caulobacter phage BL47]UTU09888.1 hypothetical protein CcrRB23_gp026 [Caulobacter phage RB23]WGN96912.1 hypothetical protein [Bertelyvirus sp.]